MIVNEDLIPYVLQSILSYLTNFTTSSHLLQQLYYHDRDSRRRPRSTLFFRDKVEYRALTRRWLRDADHTQCVSRTLCTRDVKEAWSSSTSIRGATDRDILRKHNARPRIELAGMLHSHYRRFRSLCHALRAPPREIFPLCLFFSWLFARISHAKIVNRETSLTSGGQRVVNGWQGESRATTKRADHRSAVVIIIAWDEGEIHLRSTKKRCFYDIY